MYNTQIEQPRISPNQRDLSGHKQQEYREQSATETTTETTLYKTEETMKETTTKTSTTTRRIHKERDLLEYDHRNNKTKNYN